MYHVTLEQIRKIMIDEELLNDDDTPEEQYADILEQSTVHNFWDLFNKFGVTYDGDNQRFNVASLAGLSVCLAIVNGVCDEFDQELNAPGGIWDNFELTGDDTYDYQGQHPRNVLEAIEQILTA